MPQTEPQRNPEVTGGEAKVQQQANEMETAAAPARAKQQEAQQFVDTTPGSAPEGVELQDPRHLPDQIPTYADEDEEFLYGATDRPNEPVNFGVTSQRAQPPKNVYRYLSALAQAAEDPDAPEQLHAFIRVLQDMLTEDREGLGGTMDFANSMVLDPSQVEIRATPNELARYEAGIYDDSLERTSTKGLAQRGSAWELPNWGDEMPPGTIPESE
jgi:hypothetical protein